MMIDIKKKIKIKAHGDTVHTNFRDLNLPENWTESKSFIVVFIDSLLVYDNRNYLQVYLDNCAYNIVDNQILDYLDDNLFEADED